MAGNYDGDLDKASGSVQAFVTGYNTCDASNSTTGMQALIEAAKQVNGETDIDQLWLDFLILRHAATKQADPHDGCVQLCMNLLALPGIARQHQLTTLENVILGVLRDVIAEHSDCVAQALAESKAKTTAPDPHATKPNTDDPAERLVEYMGWLGEAAVVGAAVVAGGVTAFNLLRKVLR